MPATSEIFSPEFILNAPLLITLSFKQKKSRKLSRSNLPTSMICVTYEKKIIVTYSL